MEIPLNFAAPNFVQFPPELTVIEPRRELACAIDIAPLASGVLRTEAQYRKKSELKKKLVD